MKKYDHFLPWIILVVLGVLLYLERYSDFYALLVLILVFISKWNVQDEKRITSLERRIEELEGERIVKR